MFPKALLLAAAGCFWEVLAAVLAAVCCWLLEAAKLIFLYVVVKL